MLTKSVFVGSFLIVVISSFMAGLLGVCSLTGGCQAQGSGFFSTQADTHPVARRSSDQKSISLITWNLKRLGRDAFRGDLAARVLAGTSPDIVLAEEVLSGAKGVRGVMTLAQVLKQVSGGREYCFGISDPSVGQHERKAIFWAKDSLSYVTTKGTDFTGDCTKPGITLPLMLSRASELDREPAYAVLRHNTLGKFVVAAVHLVPTAKKPAREVGPLFDSPRGTPYSKLPTIIAGDFNLAASHEAFSAARTAGYSPTLPSGIKTSLKMKTRAMSAEYDNIWVKGMSCGKARVLDTYAALPEIATKTVYNDVSDHAPVIVQCK